MIVRFRNDFRVPGFGRKRFSKGVVLDVPAELKGALPQSAEILDDTYVEEEAARRAKEAELAEALVRQGDKQALIDAGISGVAEANAEAQEMLKKNVELAQKLDAAEAREKAALEAVADAEGRAKDAADAEAEATALLEEATSVDAGSDKAEEDKPKASRTKK